MEPKLYQHILSQPLAFWVASSNAQNIPDAVRCVGVVPGEDLSTLTFFIAEKYSEKFLANVQQNRQISLLGCSVINFESYQYKGIFQSKRPCTTEEVALQNQYLNRFKEAINSMGLLKEAANGYFNQPSLAVDFTVTEIYEQTPQHGTGKLIKQKAND